MRILVVDDSAFMRKAISLMLSSEPGFEVVGTAFNGADGVEKAKALKPDVITLDIEMPVMDGLAALKKIRQECFNPRPAVLMCSTLTSAGSHEALKALQWGAADVIAKDPAAFGAGLDGVKAELIAKVRAVGDKSRKAPAPRPASAPASPPRGFSLSGRTFDLVVIGSSTGGPPVLEQLLLGLPADFPCPIVIAQHMPRMFTKSMSERLDEMSAISVHHGEDAMPLRNGTAYMIPGGTHGRIRRSVSGGARFTLEVGDEPKSALYRPSANELFRSAGETAGARCLGVMLTGMGDDGVVGAKTLHVSGGLILAQDAESCVVYGMPKAVADAGLAAASLPPVEILKALAELAPKSGGLSHAAPAANATKNAA